MQSELEKVTAEIESLIAKMDRRLTRQEYNQLDSACARYTRLRCAELAKQRKEVQQ